LDIKNASTAVEEALKNKGLSILAEAIAPSNMNLESAWTAEARLRTTFGLKDFGER